MPFIGQPYHNNNSSSSSSLLWQFPRRQHAVCCFLVLFVIVHCFFYLVVVVLQVLYFLLKILYLMFQLYFVIIMMLKMVFCWYQHLKLYADILCLVSWLGIFFTWQFNRGVAFLHFKKLSREKFLVFLMICLLVESKTEWQFLGYISILLIFVLLVSFQQLFCF